MRRRAHGIEHNGDIHLFTKAFRLAISYAEGRVGLGKTTVVLASAQVEWGALEVVTVVDRVSKRRRICLSERPVISASSVGRVRAFENHTKVETSVSLRKGACIARRNQESS